LARVESPERAVTVARWHFDDPPDGAVPVLAHENETLWLATTTPPSAAAKPACWVEVVDTHTASDLQEPAAPVAIEIRYPSHASTFSVSVDDLCSTEENLQGRIDELTALLADPPATPRPGDQCRYCDVRQFCDAYWKNGLQDLPTNQAKQNEQKSIDIELTVRSQPSATGFAAQSRSGRSCTVVHSADGQRIHGPVVERDRFEFSALGLPGTEKRWS
jgi:hypothetical protein